MGSRLHGNDGRRRRSHNRRRESTHHNRHSRDGGNPRGGGMGSGDGFPSARERRAATAHPQSSARIHAPTTVIPATAGIHGEGRRWVPVCTGTTGGGGHSREGPRRGAAIPSATNPRGDHGNEPTIVIPATAGIHGGGRRWVPVCTGTTGGGGGATIVGENPRTHNRHSREGGNPRGGGGGDGFPSARERRAAAAHPQSSFPRRRESTAGIHGHSREGGNPRGDGFPSARERRAAAGAPTIVGENPRHPQSSFPRRRESTGGPAMGSRLHGNDGRRRAHPQSSARIHAPTIVIPATAGIHGGGPAMGSRLHGTGGGRTHNRRRESTAHNRHSRDGGNPRRGPAMGSRLHGNNPTTGGGGRTHNRRRESTAPQSATAAMGSRLHGNDGRRRAHPQSSARIHGPTIVIPAKAGIHGPTIGGGNPAMGWVPVCTGTTGGGGRTHNRHSREWSNARVSLSGNDGARPCGSWSCTRAGRRPSPSRSRRRCWASGLWRSRPPARRRA